MKSSILFFVVFFTFFFCTKSFAQYGRIYDVAGGGAHTGYGTDGYGDGCRADSATINYGDGIALDKFHNVYFIDQGHYIIRKVNASTGIITAICGNDTAGYSGDGGLATNAKIGSAATGLYIDTAGNIYFSDANNYRIRMIDAVTRHIQTIAGTGTSGYSGDNGLAISATISNPQGIYIDKVGNIFFADRENNIVRKIVKSTGVITAFAGTPNSRGYSGDGSIATSAKLNSPSDVAGDKFGNIYIVDNGNNKIRKVDTTGTISTISGIDSVSVTTPGFFVTGYNGDGGPAVQASLHIPSSICVDTFGNIYFNEQGNKIIRKVDIVSGLITTVAGTTTNPTGAGSLWNTGIASDSFLLADNVIRMDNTGVIYYASNYQILKIVSPTSAIATMYVSDSLETATCTIPTTIAWGIHGTVNGTPTSSDSMRITIDYQEFFVPNAKRNYVLPYKTGSVYSFGDTFNRLASYTYKVPGIYRPTITIHTLGGFADMTSLPTLTVGSTCSSSITNISFDSVGSRIITAPCVAPATVRFSIRGKVSGIVSSTDSIYVVYKYNDADTIYETHVVPIYLSGTNYYFIDSIKHNYTPGSFSPSVLAVLSSGQLATVSSLPGIFISACSTGSITIGIMDTATTNISGSVATCTIPYCDQYSITGDVSGLATVNDSVTVHFNFQDGVDSIFKIPITTDGQGDFFYNKNFSNYIFTHKFSTNGIFTPLDTVYAGTYRVTAKAKTLNVGTDPAMDMHVAGWNRDMVAGDTGFITIWAGSYAGNVCDTLQYTTTLTLDAGLTYAGMQDGPVPTTISGPILTWVSNNNTPPLRFYADVKVAISSSLTLFDSICNTLQVRPNTFVDSDTTNNTYNWCQRLQASKDTFEKYVSPRGSGPTGIIAKGTPLNYLISFRNNTSSTIDTVIVADLISTALDPTTLQILGSSAPVTYFYNYAYAGIFTFNNINLRSSIDSPDKSAGYVAFSIMPMSGLSPGTEIINKAVAFFHNPKGTYTNTTLNTIIGSAGLGFVNEIVSANGIVIYPNPAKKSLQLTISNWQQGENNSYTITDITGRRLLHGTVNASTQQIDISKLQGGMYFIQVNGYVQKFVKE